VHHISCREQISSTAASNCKTNLRTTDEPTSLSQPFQSFRNPLSSAEPSGKKPHSFPTAPCPVFAPLKPRVGCSSGWPPGSGLHYQLTGGNFRPLQPGRGLLQAAEAPGTARCLTGNRERQRAVPCPENHYAQYAAFLRNAETPDTAVYRTLTPTPARWPYHQPCRKR